MFVSIRELANGDVGQWLKWSLAHIEAIDTEKQLCLYTTRGNAKNGHEKYFIRGIVQEGERKGKIDFDSACVRFRAWDLSEAIHAANTDARLIKRIQKIK